MNRSDIINYLYDNNIITYEMVSRVEAISLMANQPLELVLNQLGLLSDDDLANSYSSVLNIPIWDPNFIKITINNSDFNIENEFLSRVKAIPVHVENGKLLCAVLDPFNDEIVSGLSFVTGMPISLMVAKKGDWQSYLNQNDDEILSENYLDEGRVERDLALFEGMSVEGRAVEIVANAFGAALEWGASDIHFEPRRHSLIIRFRVDGRLRDYITVSSDLVRPCASRIKVLASLNVAERRLPQDGRASFVHAGRSVDVRVATSPTVFGEGVVLRILDQKQAPKDIRGLDLRADMVDLLERVASTPHGLFLVTGPTGSGKTTTLYALLSEFIGKEKKIMSVEDPVERHFDHVSQTQVQPSIGLSFSSCLRSFLRHDPDVMMVGEIRDAETASVAVQAAMTGHLVLASIHANSAMAALPRLRDMGVEPYQLSASIRGVMAQRLVRRLCTHCRLSIEPEEALISYAKRFVNFTIRQQYQAVGCSYCHGIGYRGRIAIAEGFWVNEDMSYKIGMESFAYRRDEISKLAKGDYVSLREDAFIKINQGQISFEEILLTFGNENE